MMTSRRGSVWYWRPELGLWEAVCRAYATEQEATVGLGEALAQEQD